jgi:hypothetical protein
MATKSSAKHTKHHDKDLLEQASSATGRVARQTSAAHRMGPTAEVLASGDPKRIEKYFLRRWAYRMFGRFMNKTMAKI